MTSRWTKNLSKIASDKHWIFINAKRTFLQPLTGEMLIFAFQEGLKIHQISSSKLIKKYCEKYIEKRSYHDAKNLPNRVPKLSQMAQISVTHIGVK